MPSQAATPPQAPDAPTPQRRVFISYVRDAADDSTLAWKTYEALRDLGHVFIDRLIPAGANWADRINAELDGADYFICFLSEASVRSQMVFGEIEAAHRLAQERPGRPVIIPVRVAYRHDYPYPLNAFLSLLNWVTWEKPEDTPNLIETLREAVSGGEIVSSTAAPLPGHPGGPLPPPLPVAQLEQPGGTMNPESKFYVRRTSDRIADGSIHRPGGVTIAIKGPRQVGKSSLLVRLTDEAVRAGKQALILDFQLIGVPTLRSPEELLKHLCMQLASEIGAEKSVEDYWQQPLGPVFLCTQYIEKYILGPLRSPLLLAMDDVDKVFDADFRSDFFGMLRGWHNRRAQSPHWRKLDMVLVTSSEPSQFITSQHQSPFNVAAVVEPSDFTEPQVAELTRRHGLSPGTPDRPGLSARLMSLLSGHPYLTRVALYEIATENYDLDELVERAVSDSGPFGQHLLDNLLWLHGRPELKQGLREVIGENRCSDGQTAYRLQSAGLVRVEDRRVVRPRCELYSKYFAKYLYD